MGMYTVPTADPGLRRGRRADLLFGLNLSGKEGALKNR